MTMKTYLLICFMFIQGVSLQSMEETDSHDSHVRQQEWQQNIKKMSDDFYIGKMADKGPYFIMERIDEKSANHQRLKFWQKFADDEKKYHDIYKKDYWANERVPNEKGRGFLSFSDRSDRLSDALDSFKISMGYSKDNELWICYASRKLAKSSLEISHDDIELAFTLMTTKDAPMTTHMGINRSFNYLINAIKERELEKDTSNYLFPVHGNLSVPLHSFAAKVMKIIYPEKVYMITSPVHKMKKILENALPKKDCFEGDNITMYEEQIRAFYENKKKSKPDLFPSLKIKKTMEDLSKEIENLKTYISDKTQSMFDRKKAKDTLNNKKNQFDQEDINLMEIEEAELGQILEEFFQTIPTTSSSPLIHISKGWSTRSNNARLKILSPDRKSVVFDHDQAQQIVHIGTKIFKGAETKQFDWFYHSHMRMFANPYLTVSLDALANASPLVPVK